MLGTAHEETARQTREAGEESELAGGVREAAGLRSEWWEKGQPREGDGRVMGVDFRPQASPTRPSCPYARMRSPSPTWSRELPLLSRCCSTDCSNARAATRLKKAFTFSPVSPRNSCDPVYPYPQPQSIWVGAGGYEG